MGMNEKPLPAKISVSLSESMIAELKRSAKAQGLSVSKFVAQGVLLRLGNPPSAPKPIDLNEELRKITPDQSVFEGMSFSPKALYRRCMLLLAQNSLIRQSVHTVEDIEDEDDIAYSKAWEERRAQQKANRRGVRLLNAAVDTYTQASQEFEDKMEKS